MNTKPKPTRGGRRSRAGRPKKPRSERFVNVTISLPPQLAAVAQLRGGSTAKVPNLAAIRRGVLDMLERPIVFMPD